MRRKNIQYQFKQRAVTLIELMIVIALTGIIASIAIPSYKDFIVKNNISSFASNLHGALMLARTEAITRGLPVAICKSTNPNALVPACDGTASSNGINTGWGSGWLIFVNPNRDGVFPGGNTLIRAQPGFIASANLGSIVPSDGIEFILFNMTGQTTIGKNFVINRPANDNVATHDKAVCILTGGRVRVGPAPNCPITVP